ncbi:MAG: TssA family type VI secretion system protein [Candidatus Cloacimonetes bacterium]|nr:TssA family type VI secretion system protein [Candidatus Cloacimonadota bacterium]
MVFNTVALRESKTLLENYPNNSELYYAIDDEIRKLRDVNSNGYLSVDWGKIIDDSMKLLENEAKDLKVWGNLSLAVLIELGLEKYMETIELLNFFVTNSWEMLYPPAKRMRGRKNSLEWWYQESIKVLELGDIIRKDLDAGEAVLEEILKKKKKDKNSDEETKEEKEFNEIKKKSEEILILVDIKKIKMKKKERDDFFLMLQNLEDKLYEEGLSIEFSKLTELMSLRIEEINFYNEVKHEAKKVLDTISGSNNEKSNKDAKNAVAKENNRNVKPPQEENQKTTPQATKNIDNAKQDYSEMTERALLKEAIRPLRVYYQKRKENNKVDYKILEINEFISRIETEDKPEIQGKNLFTHLSAPQFRDKASQLSDEGKWQELINECSEQMREYKYWFDLDYYIYQGLLGLGKKQQAEALINRTKAFIKSLGEEILNYKFNDGSELASIFTRTWLQEEVKEGPAKEDVISEPEKVINVQESLKERGEMLVSSNNLMAAIDMIREEILQCQSKREEAELIELAAHFFEIAGKNDMALELLQNCYYMMKNTILRDWDKEMLVEIIEKILELKSSFKGKIDISEEVLKAELRELEPLESIVRRK